MEIAARPSYQQIIPREGPKCVPITLELSVGDVADIHLEQIILSSQMTEVQSIWIDASEATDDVEVTPEAGMPIAVMRKCQAWMPIIVDYPWRLSVSGVGKIKILLCNAPMPATHWRL